MTSISRFTGARIDGASTQHLMQSIGDILTTPLGTRRMRPTYGSELPDLIDQPLNPHTRIRIFAAVAGALLAWEPRVRLKRVQLTGGADGRAALELEVLRTDLPTRPRQSLAVSLRPA